MLGGATAKVVVFKPALDAISRGVCGPIVKQRSSEAAGADVAALTGSGLDSAFGASALLQAARTIALAPNIRENFTKSVIINGLIELIGVAPAFLRLRHDYYARIANWF